MSIRASTSTSRLLQSRCNCRISAYLPISSSSSSSSAPFLHRSASSQAKKAAPAAKKKQATFSKGKAGGSNAEGGESKAEGLRKMLYGNDASARKSHDLERMEALQKVIPSPEVHETIMRAWQLHRRKQRDQREQEMQARYDSMVDAVNELEKASPRLFNLATKGPKFDTVRGTKGEQGKRASLEGRIPGLFPRQLPVIR